MCFILGILKRSGTNYLSRLLQEHPDTRVSAPIWEDHLLHHSDSLLEFVDSVYDGWTEYWEIEKEVGPKSELQRYLGIALRAFLKRQLGPAPGSDSHRSERHGQRKVLLTKTPSARGIGSFFDLFPEDHLIVVVRDGRAVVESGVRSFGWEYEAAMREWAGGAEEILRAAGEFQQKRSRFLLVRYEDVFQDERGYLEKVSAFLGLDPTLFRQDNLDRIPVLGSCEHRNPDGAIHWEGEERTSDFDPLSRFAHWDKEKHALFNQIAGESMEQLGYQLA